tara:strand:+ start:66 stop:1193 length:1128 start_codon:yes stop_codon:yes gene_type:complete
MKNVKTLLILNFFALNGLFAQTQFDQDAYFSNLNSFQFFNKEFASLIQIPNQWNDQQFHLRWNARLYHGKHWSAKMSLRNRIFTGYSWEENLFSFKDALEVDVLDLIAINKDKVGLHHEIDRFFVQWEKGNWNVRLGRQRINWGIQNYWNSHDLFNQINFFDFDYIERPGSDVLRIQYYGKGTTSSEFAINKNIKAGLYKFNASNYDFQTLLAKYFDDYVLGFGWAGQIKKAGFKGEFAYFVNSKSKEEELVGSIGIDYSFQNGIYLSSGCLYRSQADNLNPLALFNQDISAKNPMPFNYNFLHQINYPIHPLLMISFSFIHDGDLDYLFTNPMVTYSVFESLDLMIISQNIWISLRENHENLSQTIFTRLQWNF